MKSDTVGTTVSLIGDAEDEQSHNLLAAGLRGRPGLSRKQHTQEGTASRDTQRPSCSHPRSAKATLHILHDKEDVHADEGLLLTPDAPPILTFEVKPCRLATGGSGHSRGSLGSHGSHGSCGCATADTSLEERAPCSPRELSVCSKDEGEALRLGGSIRLPMRTGGRGSFRGPGRTSELSEPSQREGSWALSPPGPSMTSGSAFWGKR